MRHLVAQPATTCLEGGRDTFSGKEFMGALDFRLLGRVVYVIPGLSRHFGRVRGALGGGRVERMGQRAL